MNVPCPPGKYLVAPHEIIGITVWWYRCRKLICLSFFRSVKNTVSSSSESLARKYT